MGSAWEAGSVGQRGGGLWWRALPAEGRVGQRVGQQGWYACVDRPACTAPQVGGFEAYLLADEDSEQAAAAEVYRQVGWGGGGGREGAGVGAHQHAATHVPSHLHVRTWQHGGLEQWARGAQRNTAHAARSLHACS